MCTTENPSWSLPIFDVSLRQRKTSGTVSETEERKITWTLHQNQKKKKMKQKVQHCTDPWSPLVPDFPQDHLKSSSTNPKKSVRKKKNQEFALMDNALSMHSSDSATLLAEKVHTVLMWLSLDLCTHHLIILNHSRAPVNSVTGALLFNMAAV